MVSRGRPAPGCLARVLRSAVGTLSGVDVASCGVPGHALRWIRQCRVVARWSGADAVSTSNPVSPGRAVSDILQRREVHVSPRETDRGASGRYVRHESRERNLRNLGEAPPTREACGRRFPGLVRTRGHIRGAAYARLVRAPIRDPEAAGNRPSLAATQTT